MMSRSEEMDLPPALSYPNVYLFSIKTNTYFRTQDKLEKQPALNSDMPRESWKDKTHVS